MRTGSALTVAAEAQFARGGVLAQDDVVQRPVQNGQAVRRGRGGQVEKGGHRDVVGQAQHLTEASGGLDTLVAEVPLRPARAYQALRGTGHVEPVAPFPGEQDVVSARCDADLVVDPHRP